MLLQKDLLELTCTYDLHVLYLWLTWLIRTNKYMTSISKNVYIDKSN